MGSTYCLDPGWFERNRYRSIASPCCPRRRVVRQLRLVGGANRSNDVVDVVEQVTTRVALAIGTCDFAITQRDRRDLICPPPSTEL
jgi:hypothetical protein